MIQLSNHYGDSDYYGNNGNYAYRTNGRGFGGSNRYSYGVGEEEEYEIWRK